MVQIIGYTAIASGFLPFVFTRGKRRLTNHSSRRLRHGLTQGARPLGALRQMDLALFDFDGTITRRETMPDFMHAAVRPHRLLPGKLFLAPLILGYKIGVVPGSVIRAMICYLGFCNLLRSGTQGRPSYRALSWQAVRAG